MPSDQEAPVLIWGAGAMGGTIGAALIDAGHPVRFVDQDESHVRAIMDRGLRIQGPVRDLEVEARADTPDTLEGRFGRVLLCVKAHHTTQAVQQLEPFVASDGYVASIQNGLNEIEIAKVVGTERTVGAFVNFGADVLGPGVVHWGGRGAVVVGELDGRTTPRISRLHTCLTDFEPDAVRTSNILGYLWGKLAYGAMLFVTALTDESIADVFADARYQPLLIETAREVARVAAREGIHMEAFDGFEPSAFAPDSDDAAALESIQKLEAFNRRSAKTHSGIWRDLAIRKRPTEVDAQLGPIAEAGHRHEVDTPLIRAVIGQIHEIERGERAQRWSNLDEILAETEP